ncbi:MAG: lamin tail domain-containing protein [Flavitalea sp.]
MLLPGLTGYGQPAAPMDIVINEVLFNPPRDGYDYIEGYNRSAKTIDLSEIKVAGRNSVGDISGIRPLVRDSKYLPPGVYFVITANEKWLRQQYVIPASALICQVSSLPSLPDDKGTAILQNTEGEVIDELSYSASWHFQLITEASGVSLERINYSAPTQDKNNWVSAAASAGYGTPGSQNSQFRADMIAAGEITVSPAIFSPDNNGPDGFALIQYIMDEPGYMANLQIYDQSGIMVRRLLKNTLLGTSGQFRWDGLDDRNNRLPQGIYILFTQVFNLTGKTKKFKQVIVLKRL